jgi:L-fuculose-phosphate aldolase
VLDSEREQLAAACRRLADEGLVAGTAGNLSVRSGDRVAVTPSGGVFGELRAEEMPVVGLDGGLVEGDYAPTSELALHLALYERMGAGAVVHTHAPAATALSCVVDEVPAVHYQMLIFGGSVRVAPYATFGTEELAENVVAALEGRSAALMQNHGAVCYGPGLEYAVEAALLLEWACGIYQTARAVGPPSVLSDEQLAEVAAMVERLGYGEKRSAS